MADHDSPDIPLPRPADPGARCPWCSAPVASSADVTCRACGATLQGDAAVEIPGVTAVDVLHVLRATPMRKTRGTLGSLFVGGDDPITAPSEADLPAIAMPEPEVRREMLRLRLDAELMELTARADALAAERGLQVGALLGDEGDAAGPTVAEAERGAGTEAGPDPAPTSSEDGART